jgi:hypothetical protein
LLGSLTAHLGCLAPVQRSNGHYAIKEFEWTLDGLAVIFGCYFSPNLEAHIGLLWVTEG